MGLSTLPPDEDFSRKLKWLMLNRVLFAILLLCLAMIYRYSEQLSFAARPLLFLYWIIAFIITFSAVYTLIFPHFCREPAFAYLQIFIDTLCVSLLIFLTGSFLSMFYFLYLIVIIYSSMMIGGKGSFIMATFCSIQYGVMIDLEYYGVITPLGVYAGYLQENFPWQQVIYKLGSTIFACYATFLLSSFISSQERKAKYDLYEMKDHVKRVDKMATVGEMAAGLAHEIKNPLASLSGSIQLLMEDGDNGSYRDRLMRIALREADRLSVLVTEFLQFAKPQAGNAGVVDVETKLREIVDFFEKGLDGDRIAVHCQFASGMAIFIDEGHFHQIILNILLNAAQAVENRGVIVIETGFLAGGRTFIKISDNGVGFDRDLADKIFDPFFTTKSKGTGLGLSIVHSLLDSCGAGIEIKSRKGRGTDVVLVFDSAAEKSEKVSG